MAATVAKFRESLAIARQIEADPALRTSGSGIKTRMQRLWTAMRAVRRKQMSLPVPIKGLKAMDGARLRRRSTATPPGKLTEMRERL